MRLKYEFETMELDDQIVAIPVGEGHEEYHGVIKLNETGARIFELLKSDITEEAIIDIIEREYGVDHEKVAADVGTFVAKFQEKGMLV